MKIFVSSVITGYEKYRRAMREAIINRSVATGVPLRPLMTEYDYSAQPGSPQSACFHGVMEADIYVLVLGARYGWVNEQTHLSATHEEYRAARAAGKKILAFVQTVRKQPEQQAFESEVCNYLSGDYRAKFKNPEGLRLEVEHALECHVTLSPERTDGTKPVDNLAQYSQTIAGSPSLVIQHVNTLKINGAQTIGKSRGK